jgi:hypothetical protein
VDGPIVSPHALVEGKRRQQPARIDPRIRRDLPVEKFSEPAFDESARVESAPLAFLDASLSGRFQRLVNEPPLDSRGPEDVRVITVGRILVAAVGEPPSPRTPVPGS